MLQEEQLQGPGASHDTVYALDYERSLVPSTAAQGAALWQQMCDVAA
jgi:hypothetical protein